MCYCKTCSKCSFQRRRRNKPSSIRPLFYLPEAHVLPHSRRHCGFGRSPSSLLPLFLSSLSEIIIDQTFTERRMLFSGLNSCLKLPSSGSISNPNLAVVHASPLFLYLPMFGEQNQMFTCFCKQTEIMSGKEQTPRHGFITMRYDYRDLLYSALQVW